MTDKELIQELIRVAKACMEVWEEDAKSCSKFGDREVFETIARISHARAEVHRRYLAMLTERISYIEWLAREKVRMDLRKAGNEGAAPR